MPRRQGCSQRKGQAQRKLDSAGHSKGCQGCREEVRGSWAEPLLRRSTQQSRGSVQLEGTEAKWTQARWPEAGASIPSHTCCHCGSQRFCCDIFPARPPPSGQEATSHQPHPHAGWAPADPVIQAITSVGHTLITTWPLQKVVSQELSTAGTGHRP